MKRWVSLTLADWRNVRRDPMLIMAISGPLLIAIVFRYAPPWAANQLMLWAAFDLTAWYELIWLSIICLSPMLLGMVSGFTMLDERDEQLIQLFAVTPLRKSGYIFMKLSVLVILTSVFTIIITYTTQLSQPEPLAFLAATILITMQAPMMALFLLAFAPSKVEGLALSKAAGIIIFGPAAAYFIDWPLQLIGGILPSYWVAHTLLTDSSIPQLSAFIIGFVYHALILWLLYRRFERRID
jgi:fluoroquinolone transport system permease protein